MHKVRLKFRQFLSYYTVNPDVWLLDPLWRYKEDTPNICVVYLNQELIRVLNTKAIDRICKDDLGRAQYQAGRNKDGSLDIHVDAYESWCGGVYCPNVIKIIDKWFNAPCGWEITFSWFGRVQYRLWRRKRKRSGKMEKELQVYRDFLESVQKDVDQQFERLKHI